MAWTDDLKERINKFSTKNEDVLAAERIKSNPKYNQVLEKLKELYAQRTVLNAQLEKVELDIDACLFMIATNEKKDELNKTANISSRINQ